MATSTQEVIVVSPTATSVVQVSGTAVGPQGPAGPKGDTGPKGDSGSSDASTLTGTTLASNVVNSSLTKVGALSGGLSGLVRVDGSGNLTTNPASIVNADISGVAAIEPTKIDGTALTQVTTHGGDVTGTAGAITLKTQTGLAAGTYPKVTVNTKGLVTASSSLSATDIPTIAATQVTGTAAVLNVANTFTGTVTAPTVTATTVNATTVNATTVAATAMTVTATASAPTDVANKAYVDAAAQGLNVHPYCRAATTVAAGNLTGTYTAGTSDQSQGTGIGATFVYATASYPTIDGVTLVLNDRVLIKNQTDAKQNGIYYVSATGTNNTLTRATDANNSIAGQVAAGDFVFIDEGTQNNTGWVIDAAGTATTPPKGIKIGTDNISFTQFSGAGTYTAGSGITQSGSSFLIQSSGNTLNPTSNNLDLTAVSQTNSTGNTSSNIVQGVTVDTYGRVTGVTSGTHTLASTSSSGIVTLTDSISSTSTTTAATPNSVKTAYDLANAALPKSGGTLSGQLAVSTSSTSSPQVTVKSTGSFTKSVTSITYITSTVASINLSDTKGLWVGQVVTGSGFAATSYNTSMTITSVTANTSIGVSGTGFAVGGASTGTLTASGTGVNVQEWQSSTGTAVSSIDGSGNFTTLGNVKTSSGSNSVTITPIGVTLAGTGTSMAINAGGVTMTGTGSGINAGSNAIQTTGDISGATITATTFSGSGASLTSIPNSALSSISAFGLTSTIQREEAFIIVPSGGQSIGTATSVTGLFAGVSGATTGAVTLNANKTYTFEIVASIVNANAANITSLYFGWVNGTGTLTGQTWQGLARRYANGGTASAGVAGAEYSTY